MEKTTTRRSGDSEQQAQEHRLHSLECRIEEKEKQLTFVKRQLGRDIDAKEQEYAVVQRKVKERNKELEVKSEKLESVQRKITECDRELRQKEEECNWKLNTLHCMITERDEVYQKMQRDIQKCDRELAEKDTLLSLIKDMIAEREQELKAKDMEFYQVFDNVHRMEEEVRALTNKVVERNEELRTKEEELDVVRRLINEQGNETMKSMRARINQLLREVGSSRKEVDCLKCSMEKRNLEFEKKEKDFEAMKKKFEGRVKELESREKQFEGQVQYDDCVKELKSKEKQFEVQAKRLEAKEKQIEEQVKDLESKKNQHERMVNELKLKEAQFKVQLEELKSKEKRIERKENELKMKEAQFEERVKELESKEKQIEGQTKALEFQKNQYEGQEKELESKEARFRVQVNELDSRKKQIEGQMKALESQKNQYEGRVKELELKEIQFKKQLKDLKPVEKLFEGKVNDSKSKQNQSESLRKSFEEEKVSKQKSNGLLHQVKTDQQHFTDANNSKNLHLFINLLEKYELMCSQVSDALQRFANPTKLVLDTIKGFYTSYSRQELIKYGASISRRICNLLMDELKKSSPVIGVHVKKEAMKLANDWKANLVVGDKDCLEVMDFFKFVTTYEIGSSFDAIELQGLLDIIAQQYQTLQALGRIEEPSDNQSSPTIDGRNLQFPYIEHTNEPELISDNILVNLQTSLDPAKLILDIIQNPIAPQNKGSEGVIIDGRHIIMLEQLMRISPPVKPHVREEALKLALDLKANMRESAENSLTILGFLLLLSNYGLASDFNEDEVLKLLEFVAQHKQAIKLFRTLGFMDKISDFVQNLIKKQQHIEAVGFICAYKLADKIEPVDLLRQHMAKAKSVTKRFVGKKKSVETKVKARDEEIAILETVLQCISDNNLESQDLVKEIQDRILDLKRQKENIVRSASGPSTKLVEVQQPEEKMCAGDATTVNQVQLQKAEENKRANVEFIQNQPPIENKPIDGAVTLNQGRVQQGKEKLCAKEAVTTVNQVQVHKPEEKKRAIGVLVPINDPWGNISKRPRTVVTHPCPSVFTPPPQYQHVLMPMPPQFGLPANYSTPANPMGVAWFRNSGTNHFGNSGPFPPFR